MTVALLGPSVSAARLRPAAEAVRRLAELLPDVESECHRRRLLLWLRHLSEELLAELDGGPDPETDFHLLSALDEVLRDTLARARSPDLILALAADDPLPQWVHGGRGRLLRLLAGLLESIVQTAGRPEILLQVSVVEDHPDAVTLRFLASDDFTAVGSRGPAVPTARPTPQPHDALPWLLEAGPGSCRPTSLRFSTRLRKSAGCPPGSRPTGRAASQRVAI